MFITDLSYLETISANESLLGGNSLLQITSYADAEGEDTYTLANANTDLKKVGNGQVTIGKGTGDALAIGADTAIADVSYDAQGFDKVISIKISGAGENYAFENLKVIAIDTPA
ncbi:MAG: hypothetical protein GVY04_06620 [Cyanobacteria bacterium]|jgi:hypothetical protein|nr:hypothetical protein [Cyanobacteria bacterium GSL.Bin1]